MMKQIFPTIFFAFMASGFLLAQMPENITLPHGAVLSNADLPEMACADQFAGTIQLGNFQGSSNDVSQTLVYMCVGDQFDVIHNGDADLSGDPQNSTTPGITYAFYDCAPTITGPDLSTIETDLCLTLNPPPTNNIYVTGSLGTADGNATFVNQDSDGNNSSDVAEFFDGGASTNGHQLIYAPITIDEFATNGYEELVLGSGDNGPCVNANVDEAFSVIFLNEINTINQTSTGCNGSFEVNGGLPQFDQTSDYTINIALSTNPAITGNITSGAASTGDVVNFTAPQAGTYDITITDDKACPATFQMTLGTCTGITLNSSVETTAPGSNVCVDVTVEDWTNVVSVQFSIDYDEAVLDNPTFQNFNPNVPGLGNSSFNDIGTGIIASWNTANMGTTLANGALLLQVCFDVIGAGGTSSPISFDNSASPVEVFVNNGTGDEMVGLVNNSGAVNITILPIFVGLDSTNVSCLGSNDGTFTVTASGGVAPYNVTWQGTAGGVQGPGIINIDGGDFTATTLDTDTYSITITDNAGEMVTTTVMIEQGESIGANISDTQPTCFGNCNGSVTANVLVNGVITSPIGYTFLWNTGDTDQTLNNLCQGPYAVTITSPDGCTSAAAATLGQPGPLDPNPTITDATCSGSGDGSIQLNIIGGIATYMTDWLVPDFIPDGAMNVNGLDDGIYFVEITDINNCIDTFSIEVGAVKVVEVSSETITPVSCSGVCDASITVIASTTGGASAAYNFNWIGSPTPPPANNNGATSQLTGLCAGTYTLFLTDTDGCGPSQGIIYTITEPDVLDITLIDSQNESCLVGNDGAATIGVTGGSYPYTYNWTTLADTDSIVASLAAGTYPLMVSDANGCSETFDVIIQSPQPPLVTDLQDATVSCPTSTDGQLTVTAQDGSSPINTYAWSNGGMTNTISDLAPGEYVVTITATDGCFTIDTALVLAPDPITIDNITLNAPSCPGESDGSIAIGLIGGTSPYFLDWGFNSGENLTLVTDLSADNYIVTVTDANGCDPVEFPITLEDPPTVIIDFSNIAAASCAEGNGLACDGQATVTAAYSDGTPFDFFFTWQSGETDNSVTTSSAVQLCPGFNTILVSDGQSCVFTDSVFIDAPEPVTQDDMTSGPTNATCAGTADGSIVVNGQGGTAPYTYQWSTGDVNINMIDDLAVGTYQVTIFDTNGCNFTYSAEIGEPAPLVAFVDDAASQDTVTCNGDADGIITIAHNGGNEGPVTYAWQDNIAATTSDVAAGLAAGTYSVTVTDVLGCTDDLSFIINEPPPVFFEYSATEIECFGETSVITIDTAFGGVGGPYRFRVDNRPPISVTSPLGNIPAGFHTITALDANGCGTPEDFEITEPAPIIIDMVDFIEVELGDSTVALNPIVSNDVPLDSIFWTPMEGLSFQGDNPLNAFVSDFINDQSYTLTVIDENGCDESATVDVEIDRNRNVYIPNIFSPNDDGVNDFFQVFACTGVASINSAMIFNRWGDLVFSGEDFMPECEIGNSNIWDGRFKGKPADMGVYVYIIEIEFLDGVKLLYRGDITIMR